ncbi:MAG: transcriptional coactivator p15/PC4 family protein [Bacillota bacterium]
MSETVGGVVVRAHGGSLPGGAAPRCSSACAASCPAPGEALEMGMEVGAVPRLEDLAREREEEPARARGEWVAEEVGAIAKNKREAIVVRLVSRDGRRFVDVREFYWARDAGEYRPSKQGVALDVSLLPELLALLEEAGRKAGA